MLSKRQRFSVKKTYLAFEADACRNNTPKTDIVVGITGLVVVAKRRTEIIVVPTPPAQNLCDLPPQKIVF